MGGKIGESLSAVPCPWAAGSFIGHKKGKIMFARIRAFVLGVLEFRQDWTWADPARTDACSYTALDHAYDCGRDFAHRVTFRRWDR